VYVREKTNPFPYPAHVLGRCLGTAKNEGNEMMQWILLKNRHIVPRRTVRWLKPEKIDRDTDIAKRKDFDDTI